MINCLINQEVVKITIRNILRNLKRIIKENKVKIFNMILLLLIEIVYENQYN